MTKKMKRPVSFLLAVVMVASLFAAVPFTAGATAYGALVYSNDLQVGDTLVYDCFLEDNGYTIYLKGGTYSDDSYSNDGYIASEDLLIFPGDFSCLEFVDNMPVLHTSDIFESYIFVDAEGNRSDTIYVLAVDHDHSEITLGGFDPDQAAADTVTGLIDTIGTVEYTAESKALIDAAREAYDALTDVQKARVTNYTDLTDAETAYANLEAAANAAAANAVMDEIDAIGTVEYTAESKALIDAARDAYDALTDAQKALVTNYTALTDAETAYAALELAAGPYVLTVIVGEKTTRIRGNNEDAVTLPAAEPPTGYNFNGYIKSGYGTLTEEDGVYTFLFDSGDATLTAKLKQNRYYIHFDGNGNIASRPGHMNDKPCYYDRPVNLTQNGFNYIGMDFVGWNTEPDGSGVTYRDQELVKNLFDENGAGITLYAQWTDQRCEVTLVYPDEIDLQNPTYKVESGGTVTPDAFIKVSNAEGHYRFTGSEQELTGITGDTTIEVQYTFEPHDFGEGMIQIEPTCTERGTIVQVCRDCGYLRTTYLPAEHQGLVITEGYAETCTEDGLSDAVDCLVCGENLTEAVEIPAFGHYDEDEDGYCDICGAHISNFTITWNNWDGSLLETDTGLAKDATPTYDGETPTKAADAQYNYTFSGWTDGEHTYGLSDTLPGVTDDVTYTATFTPNVNEYVITWLNEDGSWFDTTTVEYGTVPTHAKPTKEPDAQYTYTFAGWNPTPVAVTGNATYKATFTQTKKPPNDQQFVTVDDQISLTLALDLGTRGKTTSDVTITLAGKPYDAAVKASDTEGVYNFKVEMAPAQIGDPIVVTVTGDAQPIPTSIKAYCDTLYNDAAYQATEYAEERALVKAILEYGQAANNVFLDGANEIASIGDLDPTAAQNAAAVFADGTGMVNGASFMALTKPEFRFYVKDDIDQAAAIAYNQAGVTATMEGGSDTLNARFVKKSDDSILIEVTGVSAENMGKEITVTVTGLGTITFNGNAFARAMARTPNNTAQQNLGAALYNYGAAAKACFVAGKTVDLSTLDDNYEAQNGDVLTGTLAGDYRITIADSAAVTLRDAVITCLTNDACFAGITPLGDATITLEGANVVKNGNYAYPGIYVPENKTLTIDGTGSLDASSSVNGDGTGCGIGGGDHISAGNIVINGGTITAYGGSEAAGIGCGPEADSGDIVINSGKVTAYGGHNSAGIGSGVMGNCGDIVINGGTVTAYGGYEGVGIGSGACGSCDDITISGGTVTAEAGYGWYCPGIGAGKAQATCGNILIKNTVTEVWAVSNAENAPVGAGQSSTCGTVRIESGANVNLI